MNSIDTPNYKNIINNINSIDPKYWGQHAWIFINSIALTYKNENKNNYIEFFNKLAEILPCDKCREHFKQNLLTIKNTDLIDNYSLLNWLMKVRNSIYLEQQRPNISMDYTLNEIYHYKTNNYYYILILIIIILVIIIFYILYKN